MQSIMAPQFVNRLVRRVLGTVFSQPGKPMPNAIEVSQEAEGRIQASLPYFRSIKNRYAGRRGFVIGNGPSLRLEDLERLHDEVTIASNKIYLAFPKVKWRPTLHTIADELVWAKVRAEIPEELKPTLIPHYLKLDAGTNCHTWRTLRLAGIQRETEPDYEGIDFSTDICVGLFGSCTVTFENLQIAAHLGLNPIYIIGCDHKYAGESNVQRDQPVAHGSASNHFIEGYRKPGEMVNPAPLDIMNRGYREARRYSDRSQLRIRNATRGGHLDAFERADFDTLF